MCDIVVTDNDEQLFTSVLFQCFIQKPTTLYKTENIMNTLKFEHVTTFFYYRTYQVLM